MTVNLLSTHGITAAGGWTARTIGADGVERPATGLPSSGLGPLGLNCPDPAEVSYGERLQSVQAGEYTFSAYAWSQGEALAWAELAWRDGGGQWHTAASHRARQAGSGSPLRLSCTVNLPQAAALRMRVLGGAGSGTVWDGAKGGSGERRCSPPAPLCEPPRPPPRPGFANPGPQAYRYLAASAPLKDYLHTVTLRTRQSPIFMALDAQTLRTCHAALPLAADTAATLGSPSYFTGWAQMLHVSRIVLRCGPGCMRIPEGAFPVGNARRYTYHDYITPARDMIVRRVWGARGACPSNVIVSPGFAGRAGRFPQGNMPTEGGHKGHRREACAQWALPGRGKRPAGGSFY